VDVYNHHFCELNLSFVFDLVVGTLTPDDDVLIIGKLFVCSGFLRTLDLFRFVKAFDVRFSFGIKSIAY